MKKRKSALLKSVIAIVLCMAMLVGSTYAWFTDSAQSSDNIVQSGNLDIELLWAYDLDNGPWIDTAEEENDAIFTYDQWEPGYTEVRYFKIRNAGNLAFQYALQVVPNGEVSSLADVIDVYYVAEPTKNITSRADLVNMEPAGSLSDVIDGTASAQGVLLPDGEEAEGFYSGEIIVAVALKMQESAGNAYQGQSIGGTFSVLLQATQYTYEEDSFGSDYDAEADFPFPDNVFQSSGSADVTVEDGVTVSGTTITAANVSAEVPAGVAVAEGADALTLTVSELESSASNVTLGEDEEMRALDVHVEGVAEDNTVPLRVTLKEAAPTGLNWGNLKLYHVEDGAAIPMTQVESVDELTAHNQFYYDPLTGDVVLSMATFSEVTLTANTDNPWNGETDIQWYNTTDTAFKIANADQLDGLSKIVGGLAKGITQNDFTGKTITLTNDINFDYNTEHKFYPIGYSGTDKDTNNSDVSSFSGTFDGAGHTIFNIHQNTWEMTGEYDGTYYNDAMGLFGYIVDGTVKNLTMNHFESEGEFAPTGVITAYAKGDCVFENIALFNCHPATYNTGVAGIVGWDDGGDDENPEEATHYTFKNITVDNSNEIEALWGTWDCAASGILGYLGKYSEADFVNCHVSAKLNVYNDVCANYQYYWYRYCGMLIGTVDRTTKDENNTTVLDLQNITATNCTVNFGDWNDYWYCELVANSIASYTHDYQFSRLTEIEAVTDIQDSAGNWTQTGNYVIVDRTGQQPSATCYHIVKDANGNLVQHNHADEGTQTVNGAEVAVEDKVLVNLPFNQVFGGYGWGVKGTQISEFGTTLDIDVYGITESSSNESFVKFKDKGVKELANEQDIKIGKLFADSGVAAINDSSVVVGVSPLDDQSTVTAVYTANGEDWTEGTLHFTGTGKVKITIQDYQYCTPTSIEVEIKNPEDITKTEKFAIKLPNYKTYLYHVGNQNEVKLGWLFEALDGAEIGEVTVTVASMDENTNASGTFTANNNWTDATLKFTGTGPIAVTISDDDSTCAPLTLYLDVVDAKNTVTSASATANNVALLSDISGGFTVSNGYTFYGNGFTVTCAGNGSYGSKALSYGFITVSEGGTLDNVQVICDIFPEAYLYTGEMEADSSGRYPYAYSAVVVTGNSTISNCYIYGARNNVFVGSGNVTIENTVTECGSLSNIHIKSSDAYTVTLDNVTTIQYRTKSDYDTSKTVLGFAVVVGDNESGSNPRLELTGDFVQYNWVTEGDSNSVSNTYAKTAISKALEITEYQHKNSDGDTTVNMGIAYLNPKTANIVDKRTNSAIVYQLNEITMSGQTGWVYSIVNNSGTPGSPSSGYTPTVNGDILPTVAFSGTLTDAVTFVSQYDSTSGYQINKFTVDLDNVDGGSYAFSFTDLKVQKYGVDLEFTVKDTSGAEVDKDTAVTLNEMATMEYTLEIVDNLFYDANGAAVERTENYSYPFTLSATKTSIDPPEFTNGETATAIRLVTSAGGDWRPAYPVLTGVSVTYWSASESAVKTVDLSTLYNSGTISNNVWTYTCDDYTLTITGGAIHSDGSVITPVVANNTLYFASTNKAFTTSTTSRSIVLTYVFTDKNASTTWNRTETVTYSDLNEYEYDYDSFKNDGTLEDASSSSSGCVTPDTLITLADGSQVRVDSLTGEEELLVWNMETGKLDSASIMFVDRDAAVEYEIIHLYFSDGTDVKVISEHGFWDYDLNKYVYLDANAADYIGHTFAKQSGNALKKVKLVDVVLETEVTTAWSPVTEGHLCYFVNGMLSMPGGVGGLFNIFEVDSETMTYDYEAMARDVQTYGLFTYEELNSIVPLSEEMFNMAGGAYLKISIGKGNLTMDELIAMIQRYSVYFD